MATQSRDSAPAAPQARWGGRTLVTAMLLGGAISAGVLHFSPVEIATDAPAASSTTTTTTTSEVDQEIAAFTSARAGMCLNWNLAEDLNVSNFRVVPCEEPHVYEVAKRLTMADAVQDLGEYGPGAAYPTEQELILLQNRVCHRAVDEYLEGKYDGEGRFASTPIVPPASEWEKGDRTLLCGIQVLDEDGQTMQIVGPAKGQEQARVFEAGRCVTLDEIGAIRRVDCTEDHLLEATGIVNLRDHFPDTQPSAQQQNDLLARECVTLAENYLGGEENLYNSTLLPFWTSLSDASIQAGSRAVNCWLMKDNGAGGFSTLRGYANESFTIDGQPPVPPPPRNPLREDAAQPGAAQPGAAAPADSATTGQ